MASFNPSPEQEPDPNRLEAWQQYCQEREAQYEEWKEQQRESETQDQQNREYEEQRIEQQRQDKQRRQDEQRRYDEQRCEDQARIDAQRKQESDRRKSEKHTAPFNDPRILERAVYDRYQQKITEENRSISESKQGLDRHDFYNIETAHELEAAMNRAHAQGVNPANEKQFQRFLDREAEQGIHQTEGKRPLADRYRELRERRDESVSMMKRGAPSDLMPSMKLYESTWEQRYRLDLEHKAFQENREWARYIDTKQAQWSQKAQSPARQRLAEIRTQTQTLERTPAREKLDQIRERYGSDENNRNSFKDKSR